MEKFNERILSIYETCSKDLVIKNQRQRSRHWERYLYKKYDINNLKNFRDISDRDDYYEVFSFNIYSKIVEDLSENYILKNLLKKNIGNSNFLNKYKGVYVDYNKLIHIHWFNDIEKNILNKNVKNFCEIGGGYGSLAELIIKNYNIKFLSIDLPEANLMTSYYLKESFPSKKFFLYDDYLKKNILTYEDFIENDIIILPPETKIDEKIKIDFFINARSMMEMNFDIIKKYFDLIHQHISDNGHFLNINRYEKTSVGQKIRIADYPYDYNWDVILSKQSFNQEWIHFLITKRQFSNFDMNIKDELIKIRKLGEKYYGKYIDYYPRYIGLRKFIKKILKTIFGKKLLNFVGKIFISIGNKFTSIK